MLAAIRGFQSADCSLAPRNGSTCTSSVVELLNLANINRNKTIVKNRQYKLSHACLSSETLIKTLNGNRLISSLQPGEKLLNNNEITKVVKHNRSYYYEIILNNNNIIKASNDHKFILVNAEIKHTEQLKINDYFTNDLYIKEIRKINQSLAMYEIKTSTNKYELYNGIICECENI